MDEAVAQLTPVTPITVFDRQKVSPISSEFRTEGDFNLVNRLLKTPRYEIPERLRHKVVKCIENVVDAVPDPDVKLRAIQTLAQLDKHNIELVKLAMPKKVETSDPSKMTDEQLLEKVQEIAKFLPRMIESTP